MNVSGLIPVCNGERGRAQTII